MWSKTLVSFPTYTFLLFTPLTLLIQLVSTSTARISSRTKRFLAFPLLLSLILIPPNFYCDLFLFNFTYASVGIVVFFRYFDLFFFSPWFYNTEVYTSLEAIKNDALLIVRNLTTSKITSTKSSDQVETARPPTQKGFAPHIVSSFVLVPVILAWHLIHDAIGRYCMTLTAEKVFRFSQVEYFLFGLLSCLYIQASIEFSALLISFWWTLLFNGGRYDTREWHSAFDNPWISTSLSELWSRRWHQAFRSMWVSLVFKPLRILIQSKLKKDFPRLAQVLELTIPTLGVFVISGIIHEYLAYVAMYHTWTPGHQLFFFTMQALGMIVERFFFQNYLLIKESHLLRRIWGLGYIYFTLPYFLRCFVEVESWNVHKEFPSLIKIIFAI
ncbi:hypothetical protein G9A89_016272 [Geosiphon pyriformis]|nr:hypothetical protein G9A89_016272 [Geosiphon pyriformis]